VSVGKVTTLSGPAKAIGGLLVAVDWLLLDVPSLESSFLQERKVYTPITNTTRNESHLFFIKLLVYLLVNDRIGHR
jgi:hypothetical protein